MELMCVKGFEMKLETHLQPTLIFEMLTMIDFVNGYEIQSPNITYLVWENAMNDLVS